MKIIKRNGSEAAFDITKIIVAVSKLQMSKERASPWGVQRPWKKYRTS